MPPIDLTGLTLKGLEKLKADIDKALADDHARQKKDALKAAEAAARKHGHSLAELMGPKTSGRKKSAAKPKYRHPENPTVTWSGRGRRPKWIKEALANGTRLEEFLIG